MAAKRSAEDALSTPGNASAPGVSPKKARPLSESMEPVKDPKGDVHIALGAVEDEDSIMSRRYLSCVSIYFQTFDESGWPQRFYLPPNKQPRHCRVIPVRIW